LENSSKINKLQLSWPKNVVYLTSWLEQQGYSTQLLHRYKNSHWVASFGNGAVKKFGDQITIEGAVYALQQQAGLGIHPAGKTALSLLGKAQYLEFAAKNYVLFGEKGEKLPTWMANQKWGAEIKYFSSIFLPQHLGLVDKEMVGFTIKVSSLPRAIMECLYLSPKDQELVECYEMMEGLNNLRPSLVQELLEQCTSVKVKRLFLYMAKKAGHAWYEMLNFEKIDLGSGKRKLVENGVYIPEFKITVPKELANGEL
jgi:hypothetical protein